MSHWLTVNAGYVPRHVVVDVAQYQRTAHEIAFHVTDAVQRAIAGAAWLKRRFPAGAAVHIEVKVSTGDRLEVGKPRTKNFGGPKGIMCTAEIPAGWFAEPGDGLLSLRFLQAVLQVLNAVGQHYDLGPPPIRSAKADTGKPALIDLFAPQPIQPSIFQQAANAVDGLVDRMSPTELVLCAVEPVSRAIHRNRLAVAHSLGVVESEQIFPAGEEQQVRAWTIRHSS